MTSGNKNSPQELAGAVYIIYQSNKYREIWEAAQRTKDKLLYMPAWLSARPPLPMTTSEGKLVFLL